MIIAKVIIELDEVCPLGKVDSADHFFEAISAQVVLLVTLVVAVIA